MKSSPAIELARRAASELVAHEVVAARGLWGEWDLPVVYTGPTGERYSLAAYGLWLPASALRQRTDERTHRGTVAWADHLAERLAKIVDAGARGDVAEARRELVQLAAVSIQAVESIDRAEGK